MSADGPSWCSRGTSPGAGGRLRHLHAEEFFRAFATNAGITLHLRCEYGKNSHHMIEALFKAAAHALKDALSQEGDGDVLLSSKGLL